MSHFLRDLPSLFPRPEQTIAGIGRLLREGEVSCVDILNACLEQVDEWETKVHAWAVLDREGAMRQARSLDEELRSGKDRGPLHGIPVGIKDIVDVNGWPTSCGVQPREPRIAEEDARVVEKLREAGAVILGKTVSTPHAWIDPPPTRNPWNPDRTPGGSSSGSAAAVSAGMCYAAIGSQTGGSITRPASYCGVAGLKPTYRQVMTTGVFPLAPSLDHIGPIARAVEDLHAVYRVVVEHDFPAAERRFESVRMALGAGETRIGRLRGFFDRRAEPDVRSAVDDAARLLAERGAEVVDLDDPVDFDAVLRDHRRVMAAEAAAIHSESLATEPDAYPPRILDLIIEGRSIRAPEYIQSRDRMDPTERKVMSAMANANVWCLLTPATVGTAPDPSTTGDPVFNSPWSYTHLPTVSFPVALASDAMPLAIQLVGPWFDDHGLLAVALWCEQVIQDRKD